MSLSVNLNFLKRTYNRFLRFYFMIALHSAKKLGLKTIQAKLGLLNSALYATYELKFKNIDKNRRHYHLVGSFDSKDASRLPSYQIGEEIYWKNGKDTQYGYSKL